MIKSLKFTVSRQSEQVGTLALCGNDAIFGCWDPVRAFKLVQQNDNVWFNDIPIAIEAGKKIEFKVISIKNNGEIQWEMLPEGLNRKFKVSEDVKLEMIWGQSKGRKKSSSYAGETRSLSPDLLKVLKHKPRKMQKNSKQQNFSPFDDAYNSDSDNQTHNHRTLNSNNFKLSKHQFDFLLFKELNIEVQQTIFLLSLHPPSFYPQILSINFTCRIIWIYGYAQIIPSFYQCQSISLNINQKRGSTTQHIIQFERKSKELISSNSISFVCQQLLFPIQLNTTKICFDSSCKQFLSHHQTFPLQISKQIDNNIIQIKKAKDNTQNLDKLKQLTKLKNIISPNTLNLFSDFNNQRIKSKHKLYLISLDFLIQKSFEKILQLKNKCSVIVYEHEKTKEQIQSMMIEKRGMLIITRQKVWLYDQWIDFMDIVGESFKTVIKCIRKYSDKYGGVVKEQDNKVSCNGLGSNVILDLSNELKIILHDKSIFKLSVLDNTLSIEFTFNPLTILTKIVQLLYIKQGKFDLISTFVSNSNLLTKQVQQMVNTHPSFFTKNIKQFYFSSQRINSHNLINNDQWIDMQL